MSSSPLSPRASGALIASLSRHVTIDAAGVQKCADFILGRIGEGKVSLEALFQKDGMHPKDVSDDAFGANFVFFVSTLNFSFWTAEDEPKWEVEYKGERYTGYLGLVAATNKALDKGIKLVDPDFYGNISEAELDKLLMGENDVSCALVADRVRDDIR
jgi:hypothetical protein